MLTRRFDGTGSETPSASRGGERAQQSDRLAPTRANRYECLRCGAHSTGLLARATQGNFCSTCGGHELVPIDDHAPPPPPA